jgi:hypothetical protein
MREFVTVRVSPEKTALPRNRAGNNSAPSRPASAAADLYEHILTIQNAADLEFPAINPANAAERDEFRLNTFPPDNHAPPAPPAPPQPTPPTK